MANNVTGMVTGGQPKILAANSVAEVKAELGLDGNYSATINGEPASLSDSLSDYDFVSFAESVKGGC